MQMRTQGACSSVPPALRPGICTPVRLRHGSLAKTRASCVMKPQKRLSYVHWKNSRAKVVGAVQSSWIELYSKVSAQLGRLHEP